jgi:glycosyltransferase involved in cell wall biosynthesis
VSQINAAKISAFVITYNRADILRACLRRLRFVDELIVVDKSSTDHTEQVTRAIADRYERVPWSLAVEDTRPYAQSLCSHDWIIRVDDDEVLSRDAATGLRQASEEDGFDVFHLPIRHWIFGRWRPGAYDGDSRTALYRRGAVTYGPHVHGGVLLSPDAKQIGFAPDGSVYIDHLSHPDVATWIAKSNRHTATPRSSAEAARLLADRLAGEPGADGPYLAAVALARSLYDWIDGLKRWEATQPDGHAAFAQFCRDIEEEFASV